MAITIIMHDFTILMISKITNDMIIAGKKILYFNDNIEVLSNTIYVHTYIWYCADQTLCMDAQRTFCTKVT
jgi:hypothetical protein